MRPSEKHPDDRAGVLGFGRNLEPPAPQRRFNRALDLGWLQETAEAILSDSGPAVHPPQRCSTQQRQQQVECGNNAARLEARILVSVSLLSDPQRITLPTAA